MEKKTAMMKMTLIEWEEMQRTQFSLVYGPLIDYMIIMYNLTNPSCTLLCAVLGEGAAVRLEKKIQRKWAQSSALVQHPTKTDPSRENSLLTYRFISRGFRLSWKRNMSTTSESSHTDGADWLDVEPDEEVVTYISLFGPESFPSLNSMLADCSEKHAFDLVANLKRLNLEFHDAIKLVNFVRSQVSAQQPLPQPITASDFADDKYLKPVLENDAVLFSLDDILEENENNASAEAGSGASSDSALAEKKRLEAELAAVKDQFANYRLAVEQTLDKRWGDDKETGSSSGIKKDNSNYYFESYAMNGEHFLQQCVAC